MKNKVAPPFKLAVLEIVYGEGISQTGEVIDLGVEHNLINKAGAWYSYGEERIGQGREAVRSYLKENPEIYETVKGKLKEILFAPINKE